MPDSSKHVLDGGRSRWRGHQDRPRALKLGHRESRSGILSRQAVRIEHEVEHGYYVHADVLPGVPVWRTPDEFKLWA